MDKNILISIISSIASFVLGYLTHVLQWNIEKRKLKYENRKQLIKTVRLYISELESFNSREFCNTTLYSQIRPYLSKKLIKELEVQTNTIDIVLHHNRYGIVPDLLDELNKLEVKWELI